MKYLKKYSLFGLGSIIASVGILTLFMSGNAHAALAYPPYGANELNAKLYGGVQQAIDWDRACYDGLRHELSIGNKGRTAINQAPSYQGKQWISLADTATDNNSSRTAPIDIDYGTTTIHLQLNMIKFICAALVSPDGAGANFAYNNFRVVRFQNDANDRAPNPMGGNTNWPALTSTRFRIDDIDVVEGNGHITGTAVGRYIDTARLNNTRYWFADPVDFNFVSNDPDGFTEDKELKVRFTLRGYNTYYYNTYQCYVNGNDYTYPPSGPNIGRCNQNQVTLSVGIHIKYHYDLTPKATLNKTAIEPGGTATVKNTVTKAAGGTNTYPTDWRLTQMNFAPNRTLTAAEKLGKDSPNDPCGAFAANGRVLCDTVQRNDKMIFKNANATFNPQFLYTAPGDIPAGTKICFVASVSTPTAAATPVWRHSPMVCMTVSKKPKLQIWGGDVAVRGKIETSTNIKEGKTFGSWVEYGAFSVGTNTRFASGSGTNNGNDNDNQDAWSKLTFANRNNVFGNYSTATNFKPLPGIAAYFASLQNKQGIGGTVDLGAITSPNNDIVVRTAGDLTITGGNIPVGRSVVILATGSVTIDGNITYSDAQINNIRDIPQVIIIANEVVFIKDSVTRIDAWLVARESIHTCSNFSGLPTIKKCNLVLTINGPVITNRLVLMRTGGETVGDPAEIFNLRPDAFLWAQAQAASGNKAQTVYSAELPPRF